MCAVAVGLSAHRKCTRRTHALTHGEGERGEPHHCVSGATEERLLTVTHDSVHQFDALSLVDPPLPSPPLPPH